MSLLLINTKKLNKLSLKEVKLPAQKERELKPLKQITKEPKLIIDVIVNKPLEPILKTLWSSLDNSSIRFWEAGGRGGEIGFNDFENNKKYK